MKLLQLRKESKTDCTDGARCALGPSQGKRAQDFQGTEQLEEVPPEEGAGAAEGQTVFARAERWGRRG